MNKVLVTDQMGREVWVPTLPKRIVSLVPSQTELLYDLGLDAEVVGQTLFCIHPEAQHQTKPRVGGTKNFSGDKIRALSPDLIIGNKEENDQQRIENLASQYPVWMSDIQTLNESLEMIQQVGALVHKTNEATLLVNRIQSSFKELKPLEKPRSAAYFIWRKPWMVAGKGTFIDDMLRRLGLINVFNESRYPEVNEQYLAGLQPEIILLSSEPYPFAEQHIAELQRLCPNSKIVLVDGECFSWYGSRLQYSVVYFQKLIADICP